MRNWLAFGLFIIVALGGKSQDSNLLDLYLTTANTSNKAIVEKKIDHLITKLEEKRSHSDQQFLRSVFHLTHRLLLKQYSQYSSFDRIFSSGNYDCLTATALYSVILNRLGYTYTVIETNYHIFLVVQSDKGKVLIESTDPINGFEYGEEKIKNRMEEYRNGRSAEGGYYSFRFDLFDEVKPEQLAGLLLFNQSVKAFNERQWEESLELLRKAAQIYFSPRITEFEQLLVGVMASLELEKAAKRNIVPSFDALQLAQNED